MSEVKLQLISLILFVTGVVLVGVYIFRGDLGINANPPATADKVNETIPVSESTKSKPGVLPSQDSSDPVLSDKDPIIDCLSDECGDKRIRRSLCLKSICCRVDNKWIWAGSQAECARLQQDFEYVPVNLVHSGGIVYCEPSSANAVSSASQQVKDALKDKEICVDEKLVAYDDCVDVCEDDYTAASEDCQEDTNLDACLEEALNAQNACIDSCYEQHKNISSCEVTLTLATAALEKLLETHCN